MSTVYVRCTTTILFYYHYIKADNAFNVNINEGGTLTPMIHSTSGSMQFLIRPIRAPKTTILGAKTALFGTIVLIFQSDSVARPQKQKEIFS
jgi:hypothetical protein